MRHNIFAIPEKPRVRIEYVNRPLPRPVAIVRVEGGEWLPFPEHRGGSVHAIKFEDDSIFDVYNGWRVV